MLAAKVLSTLLVEGGESLPQTADSCLPVAWRVTWQDGASVPGRATIAYILETLGATTLAPLLAALPLNKCVGRCPSLCHPLDVLVALSRMLVLTPSISASNGCCDRCVGCTFCCHPLRSTVVRRGDALQALLDSVGDMGVGIGCGAQPWLSIRELFTSLSSPSPPSSAVASKPPSPWLPAARAVLAHTLQSTQSAIATVSERVSTLPAAYEEVDVLLDPAGPFKALFATVGALAVTGGAVCALGVGVRVKHLRTGDSLLVVRRDIEGGTVLCLKGTGVETETQVRTCQSIRAMSHVSFRILFFTRFALTKRRIASLPGLCPERPGPGPSSGFG